MIVLGALALFLFRPIAMLPPSGSRDAVVPVLVDVSRSMQLSDADGQARLARAVALLLKAEPQAITGQAFNCYDRYVAEEEVARIAQELTGNSCKIASLNRGPKHQIDARKIRALGMTFEGESLLRRTVQELVEAHGALQPR